MPPSVLLRHLEKLLGPPARSFASTRKLDTNIQYPNLYTLRMNIYTRKMNIYTQKMNTNA